MKKFLVLCLSMILIGCGGGSSSSPNAALPSIPTGLTATGGGGQVALAWTAATGALGYNVYYGTTAGVTTTSGTKISAATSSNVITGLSNGTPYYFVVTAVNAWGQSPVSTEVSATPNFTPTGLTSTGGDGRVALAWTAVAGAATYNVYYGTTAGVATTSGTKISAATSSNTITGLTNGTPYYFVVTAVNAWSESLVSTEVSATPHFIPTGVTISGGDAQVFLNWTAVAGAASYSVYYGTAAGVTATGTKIPGATSGNAITGLTNGTPYYFVVTAVSAAGGESLVSAEVSSTPQPLTTLQSALTYPVQFAIDATNVYWTEGTAASGVAATGSVKKAPLVAGGESRTLASARDDPYGIAVDATSVYWTEQGSGSVNKIRIVAGTWIVTLATLLPSPPQYIAVDATNVYFTQFGTYQTPAGMRNSDGSVNKVSLAGGEVIPLATALNGPQTIKIDATNVYWTEMANFIGGAGTVKQVAITETRSIGTGTMLVTGLNGSRNIAVDSTSVFYWSDFGTLATVPFGGGISTTLVSGMSSTSPLALGKNPAGNYTDIYWTESSTQNTVVKKFNKASGKVTALMTVPTSNGIARNTQGITVDATRVYWMESDVFGKDGWTGVGSIYSTLK